MSEIVLFQTIQLSSIWPIDRILSGATTAGQSGPGSDSPKVQRYWNLNIRLFSVIPRTLVGGGGLTSLQEQSVYSSARADWAKYI